MLELGCGQGRDAVFFARNCFDVHAVDLSEVSISQLKENILRLGLGGENQSIQSISLEE
ncbi:MAG: class I SAM-dependent methyltransferase [Rhabdochlamydiaceae bacterium]